MNDLLTVLTYEALSLAALLWIREYRRPPDDPDNERVAA